MGVRRASGRLAEAIAVVAVVGIAVFANVLAARHYRRWDVTSAGRWSLAPATVETLQKLPDAVDVFVLQGPGDPTATSVRELLVAYEAAAGGRLRVHRVDPDRDGLAYADVRRRFGMEDGRTEAGAAVADAAIVVARGDRHWFIAPDDLVAVEKGESGAVTTRPREERAITGAIRRVLAGEKARLCFVEGHGEPTIADELSFLRDLLTKDNYEVTAVPGSRAEYTGCAVAVIPGLRSAVPAADADALRRYALAGGRLLLAIPPIPAADPSSPSGLTETGLGPALAPFGVAVDEAMVFEDDQHALPGTGAVAFAAEPVAHPITEGLVTARPGTAPTVYVHATRSFHTIPGAPGFTAAPLLQSSAASYAAFDLRGAAEWSGPPARRPSDRGGPLVLAYAGEGPSAAGRAPRLVVFGTASGFAPESFRADPRGRGFAFVLGGALSWLAERPMVLDVPDRPALPAGVRLRESDLAELFRTVVLYLPLAVFVLFVAVYFLRRSGDAPGALTAPEAPSAATASKRRRRKKDPR